MGARDTALSVLIACRRKQAWSDGALKEYIARDGLDRRDAALATRLCFGVLQNRLLLDAWLARFVRGKCQPVVTDILRLAVYQIRLMDKVPPSAAVNEAVNQAKRLANPQAARLVNGVLRNMLRRPEKLTLPEELSLRYSHPPALVELLADSVGQDKLEPLLAANNQAPNTCVQVNTCRADVAQVEQSLQKDGLCCRRLSWLPGSLMVAGGSIEHTNAFGQGWIYVQDPAAKLAVLAAKPRPGMRVLDSCAAPGGKSVAAAIAMEDRGEIVSCDIHPHKLTLIDKTAQRMGLSCIHTQLQNGAQLRPQWLDGFDLVIADVPCSGLGVIRKKPDIRYKDVSALAALPEIQGQILACQSQYVRPGGTLIYSTCTVLRRENQEVVDAFLSTHPEFSREPMAFPPELHRENQGEATLLPCDQDTDGFYICRLRRTR